MKKLIISGGISVVTIPCLCYYIAKYYIYKSLTFEQSMIVMITVFCSLVIFGLLLGTFCAYKCIKLTEKVKELDEKLDNYHYDNLEYHENNRELLLDLDKGGK